MTQLTDKIREAIIGNVGTIMSGRLGITDAEILYKRFMPTFTAEDLSKLPNFQWITSVMINNVPSAPFSMKSFPSMGQTNPHLQESLRTYSSLKYGKPRKEIDAQIRQRLGAGDAAKKLQADKQRAALSGGAPTENRQQGFLDSWIEKKKELQQAPPPPTSQTTPQPAPQPTNQPPSSKKDNSQKDDETILRLR
jgi:hypothetical protein